MKTAVVQAEAREVLEVTDGQLTDVRVKQVGRLTLVQALEIQELADDQIWHIARLRGLPLRKIIDHPRL